MLAAQRVVLGLSENSKKVEISILSLDLTKAFDRIPSDLISNSMKARGVPDYLLDTPSEEATSRLLLINADLSGLCWDPFFVSAGLVYPGKAALRSHSVSCCPGPAVFWRSGTTQKLVVRDHLPGPFTIPGFRRSLELRCLGGLGLGALAWNLSSGAYA